MQVKAIGRAALSGGINERRRIWRHQRRRVSLLSRPHGGNRHKVNVVACVCNHSSHLRDTVSGKSSKESIDCVYVFDPNPESTIDEHLSKLANHVVQKLLILLLQDDRG